MRDLVGAMEKALGDALTSAGCTVVNEVRCRKPLDQQRFAEVRAAFSKAFPRLNE